MGRLEQKYTNNTTTDLGQKKQTSQRLASLNVQKEKKQQNENKSLQYAQSPEMRDYEPL